MTPTKSLDAQIDAMIETDIDFYRECRGELESIVFPVQEELFEEEI